jgi:hypothetical protein
MGDIERARARLDAVLGGRTATEYQHRIGRKKWGTGGSKKPAPEA